MLLFVGLLDFAAADVVYALQVNANTYVRGTPLAAAWAIGLRSRWDLAQIERGRLALERADAVGRGRGSYALQAAIAQCHATAPSVEATDWERIVPLDEVLGRLTSSPVIELNRAVAVSTATGPANALRIVDRLASEGQLRGSYLPPSARGELASNERESAVLRAKAAAL